MPIARFDFLPQRTVLTGIGSITQLPTLLEDLGVSRVMMFSSPSMLQSGSLVEQVRSTLGDRVCDEVLTFSAHTPHEQTGIGVQAVAALAPDAVVSLGGGSVIDGVKAVVGQLIDGGLPKPVHIAVPTTLAGAEFAHYYGTTVSGTQERRKIGMARREVTPDVVVLDAKMTVDTPESLWRGSAIKALDHAIEGMFGSSSDGPGFALAQVGIRRMVCNIAGSTDGIPGRQQCQIAAWECYFAPASMILGLSHRIGHVLGGEYAVPHSATSGITLPYVVEKLAQKTPAVGAIVARAMDPSVPLDVLAGPEVDPTSGAKRLRALVSELKLPHRLRDVLGESDDPAAIAESVGSQYPDVVRNTLGTGATQLTDLIRSMW